MSSGPGRKRKISPLGQFEVQEDKQATLTPVLGIGIDERAVRVLRWASKRALWRR